MDAVLFKWIHGLRPGPLDGFMRFVTNWGYLWPPLVFVIALLYKRDKKTGAIVRDGLLAWFLSLSVAEEMIKPLVRRLRPPHTSALNGFVHVLGDVPRRGSFSFPSGSAAVVFAGATIVWLAWGKRAGSAAMVAATLVALSRVYVGVHFPGDVAGGALVGAGVAYGVWRFSKWASPA
jgi:undecaprenyl-diphosphatase